MRAQHPCVPGPQPRKRRNPVLLWLSQASAGTVGGLIVMVIMQMTPTPVPRHESQRAPEREPEVRRVSPILVPLEMKPEAGTAGLGDARTDDRLLASLQNTPSAGIAPQWIGRPMPPVPFNNQRKPPCEPRMETAINGGCWISIGRMDPPCGAKAFEWEGQCYTPSFDILRQPTSDQP